VSIREYGSAGKGAVKIERGYSTNRMGVPFHSLTKVKR